MEKYWYKISDRNGDKPFAYSCYDECSILIALIDFGGPARRGAGDDIIVRSFGKDKDVLEDMQGYWYEDMCSEPLHERRSISFGPVWLYQQCTEEEVLFFCLTRGVTVDLPGA